MFWYQVLLSYKTGSFIRTQISSRSFCSILFQKNITSQSSFFIIFEMIFKIVDFPAPFGQRSQKIEFSGISSCILSRTVFWP